MGLYPMTRWYVVRHIPPNPAIIVAGPFDAYMRARREKVWANLNARLAIHAVVQLSDDDARGLRGYYSVAWNGRTAGAWETPMEASRWAQESPIAQAQGVPLECDIVYFAGPLDGLG